MGSGKFSYPSNAICLGAVAQGLYFCLTPVFQGFHSGVFFINSCVSCSSCEGEQSQE